MTFPNILSNLHFSSKGGSFDHCTRVMSLYGCGDKCAQSVHHLTEADVWTTYNRFTSLSNHRQRQWVLDFLHSNTSKDSMETAFFIAGKRVCLVVWLAALGLSKSRYYDVRKLFNSGVLFLERLASPKTHQPKSLDAIAWMHNYFNTVGDHMPDRMAVHLPSFLTSAQVYIRMKEDLEARGQKTICPSHFYNLWQTEFPHVTIPKVNPDIQVTFVNPLITYKYKYLFTFYS